MGQRTQILLQTISNEGLVTNKFYHYQWGYGAVMYRELMGLVFKLMNTERHYGQKILDLCSSAMNGYDDTEDYQDFLSSVVDLETADFIEKLQWQGDNNNGYLVIRVQEKDYRLDISFGFVDGSELQRGRQITKRYLTWEEYAERHGYDFTTKEFKKMFKDFLEWLELDELAVKEENS